MEHRMYSIYRKCKMKLLITKYAIRVIHPSDQFRRLLIFHWKLVCRGVTQSSDYVIVSIREQNYAIYDVSHNPIECTVGRITNVT